MTFEKIVSAIKKKARVISHRRERKKKDKKYYRVRIRIKIGKEAVNLFHNSEAGYRAQYAYSVKNGERANKYLIQQICPRILQLLDKKHKRTCKLSFIKTSLLGSYSKAWIHQGKWLPMQKKTVPRCKKLRRWGLVMSSGETCIDLKGTYLNSEGKEILKDDKPKRGLEIHKYYFT